MAKRWQKVEITYLKKHFSAKTLEDLAKRFHTDAATVEAKLKELRLDPAGGATGVGEQKVVATFQEGLETLYRGKWSQAEKLFREVIAESRQPEVMAKARQLAMTARQRQREAEPVEPYLNAVYEKNCGRLDEALAICKAGGRSSKDERFAYLAAAVYALKGDVDHGLEALGRAIDLEPRNRVHALHDQDLEALRAEPGYRDLVA